MPPGPAGRSFLSLFDTAVCVKSRVDIIVWSLLLSLSVGFPGEYYYGRHGQKLLVSAAFLPIRCKTL